MHFHDFMLGCLKSLMSGDLELLCVILWRVWFCRNQAIHNSKEIEVGEIVGWASDFVDEWRRARFGDQPRPSNGSSSSVESPLRWTPPAGGLFKVNTDAATCFVNRSIGLGIIIRDSSGMVRASAVKHITATFSPLVAEALAMWHGILLAVNKGLVPF
ncbi:hypothetical protein LWI29_019869 [Acer saccharum]|uniref:RNase H type-1 domain-containing protein n=1 Tax=Acer saccharum TaxID=4024 RepID=A0AA39VNJ0_ACESA|nr:hypothetical protein LWI29_019869 [Acer saccharum]